MTQPKAAFLMVHPHRSKKAFEALIENWRGILVSDNYGVYRDWVNRRQLCLAHLIRKAAGLAERADESCRRFGEHLKQALQQLCAFAHAPPSQRKWTRFYSRLMLLLLLFEGAQDDAGNLAREVLREIDSLWVFLDEAGVEPTITGPNGRCGLPSCGASAPTAPRAKRGIAGWNASSPSGKPAGCGHRLPSPCWRISSKPISKNNNPIWDG